MADRDGDQPTVPDGPRSPDRAPTKRKELIGVDVGGYVIEAEIDRGGMGYVYRATHPVIGKRVAIKVLSRELAKNPATVERFVREARSVNQIGHPNIVDIFAIGALPDGRSYLVMDLLDGESLRKRLKRGVMSVQATVAVLEEIVAALMAAHAKGFIHRDLKPDNVFLVDNSNRVDIKLLDFGLAKLKSPDTLSAYRTATGAQLGTPDYMSPEQLRGSGNVDASTDIYALGVMAFEILTGRRPPRLPDGSFAVEGTSPAQVLSAVPDVTPELADLVQAMFAADPEHRPSLTAVCAVLKRARALLPPVQTIGSELSLNSMSASLVGAKPILPSPLGGSAVIDPPAPAPPARSSQPASGGAGMRTPAGAPPSTTLGAPPRPARARTRQRARRENRMWLIVGLLFILAAALALVFVLSS